MKVRKATLDDIHGMLPLVKEFHAEICKEYKIPICHNTIIQRMEYFISKQTTFVLEVDGRIAGFLGGVICGFFFNDAIKFFIEAAWFVTKQHRSKGVALLNAVEEHCAASGVEQMIMMSRGIENSEKFRRFYERKGFRLFEQHFIKDIKNG